MQIGSRKERLVVRSAAAERCVRSLENFWATAEPLVLTGEHGTGKTLLTNYLLSQEPRPRPKRTLVNTASPTAAKELATLMKRLRRRPTKQQTIVIDDVGAELAQDVGDLLLDQARYAQGRWKLIVALADGTALRAATECSQIVVPPLRERRADIPQLVRQLSLRTCEELGRSRVGISGAAMELLESYDWPGNVTELADVIDRAISLRDDLQVIDVAELPARLRRRPTHELDLTLKEVVRQHARAVLAAHRGNRSAAAKALGISRNTLTRKLNEWRKK